jgi:hypothetical protein
LPGITSSFDPDDQFLLQYNRMSDNLPPHGLSGGGGWVNFNSTSPIWKPNPGLAGVVTNYLPTPRLLILARISIVTRLLDRL